MTLIAVLLILIFLSVYVLVDFLKYLKRYHALKWKELSFERPFGILQDDFIIYPIRPFKFIPFLFSKDHLDDKRITAYRYVLMVSFLLVFITCLVIRFLL
jgi:hypothetical protein